MAKPDLEDGYLRIAHELFAALACAGFNKWEWVVIREVLDQIYGPRKRKLATLSPTEVATRAGTYKESIVRAIRSLKDGGVLKEMEHGLQFVKNYEAWSWSGNPRLTPSEQVYCHAAKTVNASKNNGNESAPVTSTKQGNESAPISTTMGNESAPNGERIGSPVGTKALPTGNESAPRAHCIERADLEKKRERENVCKTHTLEEFETGRTGEEHRLFEQVVNELQAHKPTSHLANSLIEAAEIPDIRNLPSWRLLVAARVVQQPNKGKDWQLFRSIAQTCRPAEYEKLRRLEAPVTSQVASTTTPYFKGSPDMLGPPRKHQ